MKNLNKIILILILCLSVIHALAQNPILPNPTPTPSSSSGTEPIVINPPSSASTLAPINPNDPMPSLVNSVRKNSPGKYDEYQSICRDHEYDRVAFVDPTIKEKRIAHLKQKINSDPSQVKIKIRLLKEYVDQNKFEEAIQLFTTIKTEKLKSEDEKTAEALVSLTKNDKSKAQKLLADVVINNSNNREALTYLAEVYMLQKNYFEAIAIYTDLAKLTKISYDEELCIAHALHSQHAEAEVLCHKAIKFNKNSPFSYLYLGLSYRERLLYKEAIEQFEISLKQKPTEMAYTCLAEIYFIQENNNLAISAFNKALKIKPSSHRALTGLAWAEFKNKQYDKALDVFIGLCKKDRRFKSEIKKAYKSLVEANSSFIKKYADAAFTCPD